jgi:hypothetical protein
MDSNMKPEAYSLDAIKTALASGSLTHEQVSRRIREAIAKEEQQPEALQDKEQLKLYIDYLYAFETGDIDGSRAEANKQKALAKLAAQEQRQSRLRPVKRLAIVLASMLLLVIGGELVRREWLSGKPTDDEQQYVIQGNRIDTSIIQDGIADSDPDLKQITTKSYEEAVSFWGKEPTLPKWLPEGWEVYEYYALKSRERECFSVAYKLSTEPKFAQYELEVYSSTDTAIAVFEQSKTGSRTVIEGLEVYSFMNKGREAGIWFKDTTCYSFSGQVSKHELVQVIRSAIGEQENEN